MKLKNTFGKYKFPSWVTKHDREMIKNFWGQMGRTHKDWLESCKQQDTRELCQHGPGPNRFGMPPFGATAEYFIYDWQLSKKLKTDLYKIVRGKYIHRWNNMGSLIDDKGVSHCVSTCDRWVRVFIK